jgi:hypothetical protein
MTNQIKRDFLLGFLSTSSLNISSIFLFSHHLASFLAAGDHLDMQSQPPNTSCRTCIFQLSLLGRHINAGQTGGLCPVATGQRLVCPGTSALSIRVGVMRFGARSGRTHCPKLEPLLEHDNYQSS